MEEVHAMAAKVHVPPMHQMHGSGPRALDAWPSSTPAQAKLTAARVEDAVDPSSQLGEAILECPHSVCYMCMQHECGLSELLCIPNDVCPIVAPLSHVLVRCCGRLRRHTVFPWLLSCSRQ